MSPSDPDGKSACCPPLSVTHPNPSLPPSPLLSTAVKATVHPVLIPDNQFCVMSLDPETLPAIATTLIDVLFYSNRYSQYRELTHLSFLTSLISCLTITMLCSCFYSDRLELGLASLHCTFL